MSRHFTWLVVAVIVAATCTEAFVAGSDPRGAVVPYNETEAMRCWFLSKVCSCDAAEILPWNCTVCGFNNGFEPAAVVSNVSMDSFGYSGYDPISQRIVVVFRGSRGLMNWIYNLDFFLEPYPNVRSNCSACQVHRGFYAVWESLRGPIMASVSAMLQKHPEAKGFLATGHSLGAALAVLAAAEIATEFNIPQLRTLSIVTFGEPRVGNQAFAAFIANDVSTIGGQFRVTHTTDPVPHVPMQWMGFQHAPSETWFQNDLAVNWTKCHDNATSEDPDCSDSVPIYKWDPKAHGLYLGYLHGCNYARSAPSIKLRGAGIPEEVYDELYPTVESPKWREFVDRIAALQLRHQQGKL